LTEWTKAVLTVG